MARVARLASALADTHAGTETVPRTVSIAGRLPCSTLILLKNKKTPSGVLWFFGGDGESRTRVQNHLAKGSTSVVYPLRFPSVNGDKQPLTYGILCYLMKAEELNHSCSPLSRCPIRSRGTLRKDTSC